MQSEVFLGSVSSVVLEMLGSWTPPPLQLEHTDSSNIHVFCLRLSLRASSVPH